jgi:hypothetical protein
LNEEWKGGDVKRFTGGGQKVNILVRDLEKYKNNEKKIILFTDRYVFFKFFLFSNPKMTQYFKIVMMCLLMVIQQF